MKNLDVIVHSAIHNFQLDSAKTSMMLMVFSVRLATALDLKVWHPALCSGSTVTNVVGGGTIIVPSRKIRDFFFNDMLVCMFMHFNCLRSYVEQSSCSRVF